MLKEEEQLFGHWEVCKPTSLTFISNKYNAEKNISMPRKGLTDPPMQSSSYSEAENQNYPHCEWHFRITAKTHEEKESWCEDQYPDSVAKYPTYPFYIQTGLRVEGTSKTSSDLMTKSKQKGRASAMREGWSKHNKSEISCINHFKEKMRVNEIP